MIIFWIFSVYFFFAKCSDVVVVSDSNFKKIVLGSKLPVFVKFYAPWCGHCKSLVPIWDKIATNLKGIVTVAKVDCTVEQSLCSKYGVNGYPTLKLFKDKGKVKDYQQQRDATSLIRFATQEITDNVIRIKNENSLETFLATSSDLPHAILFSSKAEPTPLFKAMSMNFEGSIIFGQVASSIEAVVSKYGPIENFPHLIVISGTEIKKYDGTFSAEPLTNYFSGLVVGIPEEVVPEPVKQKAPTKVERPKATWTKTTHDTIIENCQKNLCVVAFINENDANNDILTQCIEKFQKGNKLIFLLASLDDEQLKSKFGVTETSLLVYNAKKNKVARATSFSTISIDNVLERVLTGDFKFEQLE